MNQEQIKYNSWVSKTSTSIQEAYCGNREISPNEWYFIINYAQSILLDIGCGTGKRTFPVWKDRGLEFYGIEKFANLTPIKGFEDLIIRCDIGEHNFIQSLMEIVPAVNGKNRIKISYLMGGVINAFLDPTYRANFWVNLKELSLISDYILIDTLTDVSGFFSSEVGSVNDFNGNFPPQYFYSEKEIQRLVEKHDLKFVEIKDEVFHQRSRRHYLLERAC